MHITYVRSFLSRDYRYRDNIVVHYRDIGSTIIVQPYLQVQVPIPIHESNLQFAIIVYHLTK